MRKLIILSLIALFALPIALLKAEISGVTVQFEEAWSRETAPNPKVGVAYGTFTNPTDKDVVIKAMTSDVAERAEIHDMVMNEGVMTMRKIENPTIPAKGALALEPKGKHIMLMGMKQALKADTAFTIHFEFEDGSSMISEVKVNPIGWKKD